MDIWNGPWDPFDYGEYVESTRRDDSQDADRHYDPDRITTPIPDEPESEEDY